MAEDAVDDQVGALYRADPKRFVRERNQLAKQLRADGDRAAAKEVKGLRKPTKAAWTLNVVAHERPEQVAELRSVGEQVREAQERAVAGAGDRSLRESSDRRRELMGELTDAAVEHAGASQRDQIEATLEAASVDPAVGDRLTRGRVARAHDRPSGIGGLAALLAGEQTARPPPRARPVSCRPPAETGSRTPAVGSSTSDVPARAPADGGPDGDLRGPRHRGPRAADPTHRRLVPALRRAGYRVEYHEFDGGHGVAPQLAATSVELLDR